MGTFIHNTLRSYKINVNGLQYSRDFQTSVLYSTLSSQLRQMLYYRLADWQLHNTKDHVTLAQSSRIVHACGFSLWKHPARHSIFEVLRLSRKMNITTVLHPYFEPVMWRDHTDAISTIKKTLQFTDIATPALEDAAHLFGRALREDYVKRFLDLGADCVVLTMGKDGCLVSDGRKIIMVPAIETDSVVDQSGSNEAWHAGLYYAMNQGKELAHAAYFANAVAAYVEQHNGSLVPLPPVGELCERMTGRRFEDI
jgi:fructokinase